jgi:hypothetical protein
MVGSGSSKNGGSSNTNSTTTRPKAIRLMPTGAVAAVAAAAVARRRGGLPPVPKATKNPKLASSTSTSTSTRTGPGKGKGKRSAAAAKRGARGSAVAKTKRGSGGEAGASSKANQYSFDNVLAQLHESLDSKERREKLKAKMAADEAEWKEQQQRWAAEQLVQAAHNAEIKAAADALDLDSREEDALMAEFRALLVSNGYISQSENTDPPYSYVCVGGSLASIMMYGSSFPNMKPVIQRVLARMQSAEPPFSEVLENFMAAHPTVFVNEHSKQDVRSYFAAYLA